MKRKTSPQQAALTDRTTIKVRFSEIDSNPLAELI